MAAILSSVNELLRIRFVCYAKEISLNEFLFNQGLLENGI